MNFRTSDTQTRRVTAAASTTGRCGETTVQIAAGLTKPAKPGSTRVRRVSQLAAPALPADHPAPLV